MMDSLLETIDSLRMMQKNYLEDTELFNFDYKTDFITKARERDRVFRIK